MKKKLFSILILSTTLFFNNKVSAQCPAPGDITFDSQISIDLFIAGIKIKSDLQHSNKVDISDLDEGIYLIRINTKESILLKKIVVIR